MADDERVAALLERLGRAEALLRYGTEECGVDEDQGGTCECPSVGVDRGIWRTVGVCRRHATTSTYLFEPPPGEPAR